MNSLLIVLVVVSVGTVLIAGALDRQSRGGCVLPDTFNSLMSRCNDCGAYRLCRESGTVR